MKDAQTEPVALGTLIRRIAADEYRIPNFQRDFVWEEEDIRQLMRSLLNEYFVGSLLLWNMRDETLQAVLGCKSIFGFMGTAPPSDAPDSSDSPKSRSVVVLDGQQRVSAIHYALFGSDTPLRGKSVPDRFFVDIERFMGGSDTDPGRNGAFVSRPEREADRAWDDVRKKRRETFSANDDIGEFFPYDESQQHLFPLRLLSTDEDGLWLAGYENFWRRQAQRHVARAEECEREAHRWFQEAEKVASSDADSDGYKAYVEELTQKRSVAKAASEEAVHAAGLARQQEATVNDLRRDFQHLFNQQRQTSNGAKRARNESKLRQLERLRTEAEQELERLESATEQAQKRANELAQDVRQLDGANQDTPTDESRPDPDELYLHGLEEQDNRDRHLDLQRQAEGHVQQGGAFRLHVQALRSEFQIPAIVLAEDASEITVSDTFSQINRRGTRLQTFDLLNAATSLRHSSPRELVANVQPVLSSEGLWSRRTTDDLVRMMLIWRHPESHYELTNDRYEDLIPGMLRTDSNFSAPLIKSIEDFETQWMSVQESYLAGLRSMRDDAHYGKATPNRPSDFVPFEGMIPVYCCLLADAGDSIVRQDRVQQWYWASVLTERYSTTAGAGGDRRQGWRIGSRDYREVRAWFADDAAVPEAVQIFQGEFGRGLFPTERGRPRPRSAGFVQAVRSLLFSLSPRDWIDGETIAAQAVLDSEVLSPAKCREAGVSESLARSVFNTMLVDDGSHEEIERHWPHEYLRRFLDQRPRGFRHQLLASHCISDAAHTILSRDPFTAQDFEEFLQERQSEFLRRLEVEVFDGLELEAPS